MIDIALLGVLIIGWGSIWFRLGQLEQAIKNHTGHVHLEICQQLDKIETQLTAMLKG